ncbi:MAG: hypothetical protein L3K03_06980 [Thermoplasmata archaeon]|nr:hypothetical protein [Thermoplasmata archaeon]
MAKRSKPAKGHSEPARRSPPTKKPTPAAKPKAALARPKSKPRPKSSPVHAAPVTKTLGISKPKVAPDVVRPALVPVPRGDGRFHLLSLSFLREGDEFLARLETGTGQITELKNRSLDLLLRLAADELEDFLE